ncbi:cytochrome c [Aliiruegeria haliotis]|uniref:Cytochrome c n=1 Tax=Aliiruegeria haliotis TaxID=1280846 RepID=A0A2T0RYA5_9RHOB|nr:cytochrome c [Aliiruegeria haliotis]PRY26140.1 cytochrome c [Aliiruegeria haliotis]
MRYGRILVLCGLALFGGQAQGQGSDGMAGEALFFRYCATCHGEKGRGDGPTATVLSVKPPDLGLLREANAGTFPTARILRRIDGRDVLVSHGSPMPIYGAFLDGQQVVPVETDTGTVMASRPVLEILHWLQSIQRTGG